MNDHVSQQKVVDKNVDFASKVIPGSRGQLKKRKSRLILEQSLTSEPLITIAGDHYQDHVPKNTTNIEIGQVSHPCLTIWPLDGQVNLFVKSRKRQKRPKRPIGPKRHKRPKKIQIVKVVQMSPKDP